MNQPSQQSTPEGNNAAAGPAENARLATPLFVGIQLLIVAGVLGLGYYLFAESKAPLEMAPLLDEPVIVPPLYDRFRIVSDEQLVEALTKLQPRLGDHPAVSSVDHALRFWGIEATFADEKAWSGEKMRTFLVDNRVFQDREEPVPLLLEATEDDGVRYRTLQGPDSSSHVDHTLACLAEVGTPLGFLLNTDRGPMPLRAVLEQSMRDFSLNQVEYEWSAMALALYANAPGHWTTSEGQQMDFNLIARRTMRQRLPQGVCQGNHRLHTLVMLLRIDDDKRILSTVTRNEIIQYLSEVTRELVRKQHPTGYWGQNWPSAKDGAGEPADAGEDSLDRQSWRLLVTGHVLEWWALAPEEVLPPPNVIVNAGQWTYHAIIGLTEEELMEHYGPLSHAGRALALWRKKWPHEVPLVTTPAGDSKPDATPANSGQ
ncbi:MAG: hypothetical protein MPJ50_15040 [Pirellulales bacterium]|nr:hypothetical protein [Pirellulales bacterium]